MPAVPDLLLQPRVDAAPKAAPAKPSNPSDNGPSSFSKVYDRARDQQAVKKNDAAKPRDDQGKTTAKDQSPKEPGKVDATQSGKALPGEQKVAVSSEHEESDATETAVDPLLLLGLTLNPEPVADAGADSAPLLTGQNAAVAEDDAAQGLLDSSMLGNPGLAQPAKPNVASEDPTINALNSLSDTELDLQGKSAQPAVAGTVLDASAKPKSAAATAQPAAQFQAALEQLATQEPGGEEASSSAERLLAGAAAHAVGGQETPGQQPAEAFLQRLNALGQAVAQQSGRAAPLVPAQPLPLAGNFSEGLLDRVMWLSSQNLKSAEIQLDPAELGRLEVRVHMLADQTQVTFASANAAVREVLDGQQHRLRELFAAQGMTQVDVNVSDQSFGRGFQQQAQEQGAKDSPEQLNRRTDEGDDAPHSQATVELHSRSGLSGRGMVDFYA